MNDTFRLRPPIDDVLGALIHVGRPLLRQEFSERCCVAATRLTKTVLEGAGYKAHPKAFWVRAGNQQFLKCVKDDVPHDEWQRRGVRMVEIDTENGEGIGAHLACVAHGTLVDLSSEQFNRPTRGIHVPPWICLDLPPDWTSNSVGKLLDHGGAIMYRALGHDAGFRRSPNWSPEQTHRAAATTLRSLGLVLP